MQHFLRVQHEDTKNFTLGGPLDFDHDLQILDLPMQQPSKLSYRIENGSAELLDEILAPYWDLKKEPTENSFRIVTSLDIKTTTNFEISFVAQAATCPQEVDLEDYRHQYLRYVSNLQDSLAFESFQTSTATVTSPHSESLNINRSR